MDRIIQVAFFVHGDVNGLALECRVSTLDSGCARAERMGNLTLTELVSAVEGTLGAMQPGDGWWDGAIQPQLFR